MNLSKFTSEGKFLMLALDHRGSFKKLINPENPDTVTDEVVINLKNDIIEALKDQFSGLLIDETWGLEACHEVCQVTPFLLPLEKSGYVENGEERITELEYTVEQIKEMGASGAKLLIYFNPQVESAEKQLGIAERVLEDCRRNNFPLFLEIVAYTPDVQLQFHSRCGSDGTGLAVESVRAFLKARVVPDVWKLEYPGDENACREITSLVGETPWILLTGGKDFTEFQQELGVAVKMGAKGFLAGRALWQEVCTLEGEEKQKFLQRTLPDRFKLLTDIAKGQI